MCVPTLEYCWTASQTSSVSFRGTATPSPALQSVETDGGWPRLIAARTVFSSSGTPSLGKLGEEGSFLHARYSRIDVFDRIPVRTYFDGIGEGTVAIAISPDSQFIATISASQSQVSYSTHHPPPSILFTLSLPLSPLLCIGGEYLGMDHAVRHAYLPSLSRR